MLFVAFYFRNLSNLWFVLLTDLKCYQKKTFFQWFDKKTNSFICLLIGSSWKWYILAFHRCTFSCQITMSNVRFMLFYIEAWEPSRACVKLARSLFHVIYMNTRTWDYRLVRYLRFFGSIWWSHLDFRV